jgi:hypothetical protein
MLYMKSWILVEELFSEDIGAARSCTKFQILRKSIAFPHGFGTVR